MDPEPPGNPSLPDGPAFPGNPEGPEFPYNPRGPVDPGLPRAPDLPDTPVNIKVREYIFLIIIIQMSFIQILFMQCFHTLFQETDS